jgi:hypothetical protein
VNNPAEAISESRDILALWDHYFETAIAMQAGTRGALHDVMEG